MSFREILEDVLEIVAMVGAIICFMVGLSMCINGGSFVHVLLTFIMGFQFVMLIYVVEINKRLSKVKD